MQPLLYLLCIYKKETAMKSANSKMGQTVLPYAFLNLSLLNQRLSRAL